MEKLFQNRDKNLPSFEKSQNRIGYMFGLDLVLALLSKAVGCFCHGLFGPAFTFFQMLEYLLFISLDSKKMKNPKYSRNNKYF